jgi:ABC-type amino acid transport substrate-binding protein
LRSTCFIALSLGVLALQASAASLNLRAGTPEGLPGYALRDGKLQIESEFKRQLFQCVEKALDARFVWEALPTRRVVQGVVDGQLDLAFPMGFNEERAARMLQSLPIWDAPDTWVSMRPIDPKDKSLRLAARIGSPQHADHAAAGYARVVGATTYEELGRTLSMNMVDAVVLPQPLYEAMRAHWPPGVIVTPGRARQSGFYLNAADPRHLAAPLNRAIEQCRDASRGSAATPTRKP